MTPVFFTTHPVLCFFTYLVFQLLLEFLISPGREYENAGVKGANSSNFAGSVGMLIANVVVLQVHENIMTCNLKKQLIIYCKTFDHVP